MSSPFRSSLLKEYLIRYLVNILGSLLLVAVLLYLLDIRQIADSFSKIRPDSIYLACLLSAFVSVLASIRWWFFVKAARFPHGVWLSVRIRLVAQLLNMIVPSGVVGDGFQVFLVSRRPRLSGALTLATILSDRLMAVITVVFMLLGSAWLLEDDMADIVYRLVMICGAGFGVFLAIAYFLQNSQFARSSKRLGNIIHFLADTVRSVSSFRKAYFQLTGAFALAVLGVLGNTAIAWALLSGLAEVQFWQLVPVFCLVMLSSMVPATFSGIGIREWVFFSSLSANGLSLEDSVVLSLSLFGAQVATTFVLAVLANARSIYRGQTKFILQSLINGRRPKPASDLKSG